MTRSVVRAGFISLSLTLLALAACGGVSGQGDGGQTGGSNGGVGGQTGGTAASGGTTGIGGRGGCNVPICNEGGSTGHGTGGGAGAGGASAGAGGAGGSAASDCGGCDSATQFCHVTVGGAVGNPPSYQCTALPSACATTPTCACLQGKVGCGNLCSMGDGGITVTCQAP